MMAKILGALCMHSITAATPQTLVSDNVMRLIKKKRRVDHAYSKGRKAS